MSDKKTYGVRTLQPMVDVKDAPTSIAYYVDVLGFDLKQTLGDPLGFGKVQLEEEVSIRLRQRKSEDDEIGFGGVFVIHTGRSEGGPEIEEYYNEVRGRGGIITEKLNEKPWGIREFRVADPDGYVLRFVQD